MLDVGVMFRRVGDNVVYIVVVLPPAGAEATEIVRNKHGDDRVDVEVVRDSHVRRIMDSKRKLVPEEAEWESARNVPLRSEEENEQG